MDKKLNTLERLDKFMSLLKKNSKDEIDYEEVINDILKKRTRSYAKTQEMKELLRGINIDNLKREIAKNAILVTASDSVVPFKSPCDSFLTKLRTEGVPYDCVMDYLDVNKRIFSELVNAFANQRYYYLIDRKETEDIKDEKLRKYIYFLEPTNESKPKTSRLGKIKNLIVNQSKQDVITNAQTKLNHANYSLGESLYACMDIGKEKKHQEDGVLIIEHPANKNFKLLAVADGESSRVFGEKASNYVLCKILNWFESLDSSFYENTDALIELINNKLRQINAELLEYRDGRATTFTCAIVGKDKTLISSIGDSRAYAIQGKRTERLTKDDSYVQELCDAGLIRIDEARFHQASDIVQKELGDYEINKALTPSTRTIDNSYYDILLLVTDGVTKCIADKDIANILEIHKPEDLAKEIVFEAISYSSDMCRDECRFKRIIPAGVDNATAAVYVKQLKRTTQ